MKTPETLSNKERALIELISAEKRLEKSRAEHQAKLSERTAKERQHTALGDAITLQRQRLATEPSETLNIRNQIDELTIKQEKIGFNPGLTYNFNPLKNDSDSLLLARLKFCNAAAIFSAGQIFTSTGVNWDYVSETAAFCSEISKTSKTEYELSFMDAIEAGLKAQAGVFSQTPESLTDFVNALINHDKERLLAEPLHDDIRAKIAA